MLCTIWVQSDDFEHLLKAKSRIDRLYIQFRFHFLSKQQERKYSHWILATFKCESMLCTIWVQSDDFERLLKARSGRDRLFFFSSLWLSTIQPWWFVFSSSVKERGIFFLLGWAPPCWIMVYYMHLDMKALFVCIFLSGPVHIWSYGYWVYLDGIEYGANA